jgi:hypothetical protein
LIVAWMSLVGVVAAGTAYVYLPEPVEAPAGTDGTSPEHSSEDTSGSNAHAEQDTQTEHGTESPEGAAHEAEAGTQTEPEHAPESLSAEGEVVRSTEPGVSHESEASHAPTSAEDGGAPPQDNHAAESAHEAAGEESHGSANAPALGDATSDHGQATQQIALPTVAAPDHDSLPLWQRNRQVVDTRWLKDSEGKPKPRIAFILSELGHARTAAEEIIKKLPPAITLSFSPYANPRSLEYLIALARSNGHEVMLDLPLEPSDFPQRDPGPKALLAALEPRENMERLDWSLDRATGYVGVAVWMGSRFVSSPRQMRPLMETLKERGLIYLDNAEQEQSLGLALADELHLPAVSSHRYVDVPLASRDAIDARLAQIERIALQFGSAVAMGRPFPVTVERLAAWSVEVEKRGIVLVPISVLAEETSKQRIQAHQMALEHAARTKPKAKAAAGPKAAPTH